MGPDLHGNCRNVHANGSIPDDGKLQIFAFHTPPFHTTSSLTPVLQLLVAWFAGARFDIAYHQLKQGLFKAPAPGSEEAQQVIEKFDHGEL